jgi:hypothetical protein
MAYRRFIVTNHTVRWQGLRLAMTDAFEDPTDGYGTLQRVEFALNGELRAIWSIAGDGIPEVLQPQDAPEAELVDA